MLLTVNEIVVNSECLYIDLDEWNEPLWNEQLWNMDLLTSTSKGWFISSMSTELTQVV